ncbi:hypothetical protein NDU88_001915 [Pleurodeles waltl]|uniref:Uncharacterized protein n=1 Tax=Pleurodeles waltl TaxID=8319 RepID=A0AAV7L1Y8_PLEWA|nr:hypothetical protein NDU88_001915 [Pleurodeles waltl]
MVVVLDDPIRALPAFLKEAEASGEVSGFWINRLESQTLNLTLRAEVADMMAQQYPFQWQMHSIPDLGIQIARPVP